MIVTVRRKYCKERGVVAECALLVSGITRLGTGRSESGNVLESVTESSDLFLRYENLVTYRAVLTFGKTGFGTVGSYVSIDYLGVAESLDHFLRYKNFVTCGAVLTFGKTGFGTSRSYVSINYYGVFVISGSNKAVFAFEELVTVFTFIGGVTPFATSRKCYYTFVAEVVSEKVGIRIFVRISTSGTCVLGVTLFLTSGRNYYRYVVVFKSGNDVININVVTS